MIIITGALGFVGTHLTTQLLQAGHPVRIMLPPAMIARYNRRAWPWAEAGEAEIVEGSIFHGETLFQAMQGVHTVFHLASAQWWGNRQELEQIDLVGTRQVVTAARTARAGRIIALSHIGAEPSSAYPLLRVKGQMEEVIRTGGVPYTIFRCGVVFGEDDHFVNNIAMILRTNPVLVLQPGGGENIMQPLYIDDLIAALEYSLESVELVDETVSIGGGEYISLNELLRTVMRVSRAKRFIFPVAPYMQRIVNGLANLVFPRWPVTRQWFDLFAGNRAVPLNSLYHHTGVQPVRFEDTLLTYMPRRRYSLEFVRYIFKRRPGVRF